MLEPQLDRLEFHNPSEAFNATSYTNSVPEPTSRVKEFETITYD
jgi:hypothetical protein